MVIVPYSSHIVILIHKIQYYMIKFVSDVWQVGGFLPVLRFSPPIKLTATIELKYCWKWR